MRKISTALLVYPPTGVYDRFERCQSPVASESVKMIRPPLDLMYLAAVLEQSGVKAYLRDYPASGKGWDGLGADLKKIKPDLFLASVTVHTISDDCLAFRMARQADPRVVCVLKGFLPDYGKQALMDCPQIDIALREESEYALGELAAGMPLEEISGISYRSAGGIKINSRPEKLPELDSLPFPARHLADNDLYLMPDNGRRMGMILLSKGCPRNCIFCLVPIVNNRQVRMRSTDSVVRELIECVSRHGIRDFWFRADNFSVNRDWVLELCAKIKGSGLALRWATNSRVDSLDEEIVSAMKSAGCFAVGLGVESGSEETLSRIKKGITKEQARRAVSLCRAAGLKVYLFFILGFPWENAGHIRETVDFARGLKADVVNFSFAVPFPGTELAALSLKSGVLKEDGGYSRGNYGTPMTGTLYLGRKQLVEMERAAYRRIIFSPSYVFRSFSGVSSFKECLCYLRAGAHLIRLCLRG